MSKFTPGPWVADLHIYPVMVSSQSETWPLVDELGNEEGRAGSFICNTGNNKANARLIAAAPELLDVLTLARQELHACQAVIHLHGGFDPAYVLDAQAALKSMDAAIAKATGSAA